MEETYLNEFIFYLLILTWGIGRYHLIHRNRINKQENTTYSIPPNFSFYHSILEAKMPYYVQLSSNGKKKFVHRVQHIRDNLEFQAREDFQITEEVEILISACNAQLTFGFISPIMPYLKGVVVFPSIFFSKLANAYVKGLALGNGVVFLSWEDFTEGYKYSTSTYNLGLHEMAHMLRFQSGEMGFADHRLSSFFLEWEQNGEEVFQRIRKGNQNFFREYAGTNRSEFFSVCIENFFEVPQSFKDELPELYWHLCHLLKQNPLNHSEDYSFDYNDSKSVNQQEELNLPEYDVFHSSLDYQSWTYIKIFKLIAFIPLLFVGIILIENHQLNSLIRMVIVGSLCLIFIRAHFYKGFKSILFTNYLSHFIQRVLPLTIALSILFKIIVS